MESFTEFLTEGRDAPLYHGTSIASAESIVRNNIFRVGHRPDPVPGKAVKQYTVSFTRSFSFARSWHGADCVIEVDQRKLTHDYKIIPSNYWAQHREMRANDPLLRTARTKPHISPMTGAWIQPEAEELIIGSIENANKYITKIWIKPHEEFRFDEGTYYEALAKSGKLWSMRTRKPLIINT